MSGGSYEAHAEEKAEVPLLSQPALCEGRQVQELWSPCYPT